MTKSLADDDIPLAVIPHRDGDIPLATISTRDPPPASEGIPVATHVIKQDLDVPIAVLPDVPMAKVSETNIPIAGAPAGVPIAMVAELAQPLVVSSPMQAPHMDEDEEIIPSYTPEPRERKRRGTPIDRSGRSSPLGDTEKSRNLH